MKLLLALLLTTAAVPAIAADMPVKAPPPRAIAPVSDWTGFYVFGSAGYSWGKISPNAFDVGDATDGDLHNPKPKGGVFGFGGGYNWQYGGWVGGVEVDYQFSNEKENQSAILESGQCGEVACSIGARLNSKIDALGSARVRVGYLLFGPSLLAYGTAGVGWGRASVNAALTECVGTRCVDIIDLTAKPNLFGWVAGGGVEWQIMPHLRLRGEYLHYDFGSTTYAFQGGGLIGGGLNINAKTTDDVARGALVWSFN